MDKVDLKSCLGSRRLLERHGIALEEGEGETCSADRLTYAVDDRVVVPTCATTEKYCRLSRLHSVGLTHKRPFISAIGASCISQCTPKHIGLDRDPFVAAKSSALHLTQSARRTFSAKHPPVPTKTPIIPKDQIWTRSCRSAYRRVQRRTELLPDTTERPLTLCPVRQQSFCYAKVCQALRPLCTTGMKQSSPDDPIRSVTSVAWRKPSQNEVVQDVE